MYNQEGESGKNVLWWDSAEKSWSIGSAVGGEEVCAFNEVRQHSISNPSFAIEASDASWLFCTQDDVQTVDKIRLRWQVCDGTEGFSDCRGMRVKVVP